MDNKIPKFSPMFLFIAMIGVLVVAVFVIFYPVRPQKKVVQDVVKKREYKPVVYDVERWATNPKQAMGIKDVKDIKHKIGATAVQKTALDYYGNHATKYRFGARHEPPLYVLESDGVFEIVWYYATAKDNDFQKQKSLEYAKRIYALMGAYGGHAGENLVKTILQNPNQPYEATKAQTALGVIVAGCTHYQCRIILDKFDKHQ